MSNLEQSVGDKIFKLGMSGPIVEAIQLALRDRGYALKGTGYYGGATFTAVQTFQRRAGGLTVDGKVGKITAHKIDAAPTVGAILKPDLHAPAAPAPAAPLAEIGRPLWLEAGIALIGTKEFAGSANNPTIMDWAKEEGGDIAKEYSGDIIPWCALFENHILTKVGLEGTETLWALDFNADRMQQRLGRRWDGVKLTGPAVGAIAPMLRNGGGHVITVVGRDQHGNVMGLGANQSDTTSIIPFPPARLNEGFWWPGSVALPKLIGFDKLPLVLSNGKLSTKEA